VDSAVSPMRMRATAPRLDLPLRGGNLCTETGSALPNHLWPQGALRDLSPRGERRSYVVRAQNWITPDAVQPVERVRRSKGKVTRAPLLSIRTVNVNSKS
jgi:hypothetical protein